MQKEIMKYAIQEALDARFCEVSLETHETSDDVMYIFISKVNLIN